VGGAENKGACDPFFGFEGVVGKQPTSMLPAGLGVDDPGGTAQNRHCINPGGSPSLDGRPGTGGQGQDPPGQTDLEGAGCLFAEALALARATGAKPLVAAVLLINRGAVLWTRRFVSGQADERAVRLGFTGPGELVEGWDR